VTDPRVLGARFWAFAAGQAISAIGSWASIVAIWGYAAYRFDASTADISLVGLAWLIPAICFGPLAGTLIDRVGPRRVLIGAKALGAAASIALVFADSFAMVALFSIGHGTAFAFSEPALDAFPPRIVPDEHLASANALLRVCTDLAIVLGPVGAAGAIALWGFDGAFIADALTYVVGIASTFVVVMAAVPERSEPEGAWHETLAGIRIVARTPALRTTMMMTSAVYFLYGACLLIEPIYVRDVLDKPVQTFGLLQTAFGVFLVAGGFVVARAGDRFATRRWLAFAVAGSGVGALAYFGTKSVAVAFIGVMGWGAVTSLISGPSRTLLQRNSRTDHHGRVLAVDRTLENISHLVAMPIAGVLAVAIGVQGAAVAFGLAVVAVGVAGRVAFKEEAAGEEAIAPVLVAGVLDEQPEIATQPT
jgi:predicted MFS family arabinose efflux permease